MDLLLQSSMVLPISSARKLYNLLGHIFSHLDGDEVK
jgi:hypothetical protein